MSQRKAREGHIALAKRPTGKEGLIQKIPPKAIEILAFVDEFSFQFPCVLNSKIQEEADPKIEKSFWLFMQI